MVDWQLAAKIAEGVSALQPGGDPEPFQALVRPADESERLVSEYTGLVPLAGALPVAEAVSRKAWIEANLESMRDVIEPAAERAAGQARRHAGRRRRDGCRRAARGRGRRDLGLPRRPRARPVRVPRARPGGAGAAAVRGAQPRARGDAARGGARAAPVLGRAARDHPRAAVRRRAVAAAAPRRARAGAQRRALAGSGEALQRAARGSTTSRACSTRCARAASRR